MAKFISWRPSVDRASNACDAGTLAMTTWTTKALLEKYSMERIMRRAISVICSESALDNNFECEPKRRDYELGNIAPYMLHSSFGKSVMFNVIFGGRFKSAFKTRSPERDKATDNEAIGRVAEAIDNALTVLQNEHNGFSRRVEEAVAMASLAVGNESDEYVSRDPEKERALRSYEDEMRRGRDRLRILEQHLLNLRFLRAAFLTRFPEFGAKSLAKHSPK